MKFAAGIYLSESPDGTDALGVPCDVPHLVGLVSTDDGGVRHAPQHPLFSHGKVDVPTLVDAVKDQWYYQTVCKANASVVRLGVMLGEYHWHKHEDDDEFFFCLDGEFLVDLEDQTITLGPRQGIVVPKGVVHRTRAPRKCVILMVENAGIVPTGNSSSPCGLMTVLIRFQKGTSGSLSTRSDSMKNFAPRLPTCLALDYQRAINATD